jgi:hypothetical protein
MAEAPPEKIPAYARRVADKFTKAGYSVRITYGVSGEDRFGPSRGKCEACGAMSTVTKEGGLRVHGKRGNPCEGSGSAPEVIVNGEALAPQESICVRITKFGVGCWIDGAFDFGFFMFEGHIKVANWHEFYAKVNEVCEASGGAGSALFPAADSSK